MEIYKTPEHESEEEISMWDFIEEKRVELVFNSSTANYSSMNYIELRKCYEQILDLLKKVQRNQMENKWEVDPLKEIEKITDTILKHEVQESPFIVRYLAIKAHSIIKRADAMVIIKRHEDARKLLFEVHELVTKYVDHTDMGYVYMELMLSLGRAFLSDGLGTRALSYYKQTENFVVECRLKNKAITIFPDLLGWKLSTMELSKWNLNNFNYLSKIGIFACAIQKKDDSLILEYAMPCLVAKMMIFEEKELKKVPAKMLIENILGLVDLFINCGFLRQADHLLAVALYNCLRESEDAEEAVKSELNFLYYNIALKYTTLGCQILFKSEQLIDIRSKEQYGVKPTKESVVKLQVYHQYERLVKWIGDDFEKYENVYPSTYIENPQGVIAVIGTLQAWINRGVTLAEKLKLDRTPFICCKEDIDVLQKRIQPIINSYQKDLTVPVITID